MSIQSRLVLLLFAVVIPIMGIQALIYHDRLQARKAKELEGNLEVARAMGRTFESFVQSVLHQEIAIGVAASASPPLSPKDFTRLLQESARNIPAVLDFFWFSPQGRVLLSSTPAAVGMDWSDRDWFKEIAAGKEWVVSDLMQSKQNGKPTFAICRGIRDEQNVLLGLLVAVIVPERLNRVLAFERPGNAGVSILDRKGMNVYRHPQTEYTWEQRNWLKHYPVMEGALRGSEVVATIVSERTGIERLAAFTPVPSIGWASASSRPLSETMEGVSSDLLQQGTMFLGVTFTSMLLAFWISRAIARPMERIHRNVLSLGHGNWDSLIEVSGPLETQALANALNWMAMERKRAEEALRKSEERFRSVVELMSEGLMLFDERGIIYHNPAASRIYGVKDPQEMRIMYEDLPTTWKGWDESGRPLSIEEWPLSRVLRHESFQNQVLRAVEVVSGREIWASCNGYPIHGTDGKLALGFITIRDITEAKRAEDALHETNQELNEYTYALTHNVKAPFRAIRNYATFLLEDLADVLEGEPRQLLEGIRKAVNQAHQQFHDLEALYQIRKHEVDFEPLKMGHFLEEIASMYPKDSDRQLILTDQWPVLRTEPFLLRQILMALIDNGFKYNQSVEKRVEVGWQKTVDRFEIVVSDNGIGIDPQYHKHIFFIFKRLHTEGEYEGTGIGLAIVRRAVKKIGGELRIESALGEGSRFVISLPNRGD